MLPFLFHSIYSYWLFCLSVFSGTWNQLQNPDTEDKTHSQHPLPHPQISQMDLVYGPSETSRRGQGSWHWVCPVCELTEKITCSKRTLQNLTFTPPVFGTRMVQRENFACMLSDRIVRVHPPRSPWPKVQPFLEMLPCYRVGSLGQVGYRLKGEG